MTDDKPKIIYCEKDDRIIYTNLQKESGPLVGTSLPEIYILAVALGYEKGSPIPLKNKDTGGLIRYEYLTNEHKALISAISIKINGINSLLEPKGIAELSEQYANTGIKLLKEIIYGGEPGSFETHLEKKMLTNCEVED